MNRMRPVGVPDDPDAVAVNVTVAPSADGFADEASASDDVRSFQLPPLVTDWTKTGEMTEYLLPRMTNVRRVNVDNSTNPPTFWVGNNLGATVIRVEALEP